MDEITKWNNGTPANPGWYRTRLRGSTESSYRYWSGRRWTVTIELMDLLDKQGGMRLDMSSLRPDWTADLIIGFNFAPPLMTGKIRDE